MACRYSKFLSEKEFEYLTNTEVVLEKYVGMCRTPCLQLNKQTLDNMFSELEEKINSLQKKFPDMSFEETQIGRICEGFKKQKIYKDADISNKTILDVIESMYCTITPLKKFLDHM